MQGPTTACIGDEALLRLVSRAVPEDELASLHRHLDDCPVCTAAALAAVHASPHLVPTGPASTSIAFTRLGRFTLRATRGSGNMGTVFTAWDPELDRPVAIKVLRAGRTDPQDAARLLREARAMAQVRHPNVVTVYEVGQDDDVIFVAMELVTGATLRAAVVGAPRARVIGWLSQAARGLAAVHAAGLAHRDIKPDNIFVEGDRAAVGDFGLATTVETEPVAVETEPGTGSRRAGTPAYMAPEQRGGQADVRADIFAFGVTAWEVLTGARPFVGTTVVALDDAIRAGPRITPDFESLPAPIARLLSRCVRLEREARPASMEELIAALTTASAPARPSRRRWMVALGSVGLVAAVVLTARAGRERDDAAAAARASAPPCDEGAPATWDAGAPGWQARATTLAPIVRTGIVATMVRRRASWSMLARAACAGDVFTSTAWTECRQRVEHDERVLLDLALERRWADDLPLLRVFDTLDAPAVCGSKEAAEDAVALAHLPAAGRTAVYAGLGLLVRARALAHLAATDDDVDRALAEAHAIAARAGSTMLDAELALAQVELRPPPTPRAQIAAFSSAAAQAERAGRAALIARAWLALATRATDLDLDGTMVASAMNQAEWAIDRLDRPLRLRVPWLLIQAETTWASGDRVTARRQLADAMTVAGDDPFLAPARQQAFARIATLAGDDVQAAAVYRELLDDPQLQRTISVRELARLTALLAECQYRLGELETAARTIETALALGRTALADDDPMLLTDQTIAASIRYERGDGVGALASLEQVRAMARPVLGDDHVMLGHVELRMAQIQLDLGRIADGEASLREAIRISDARHGRRSEISVAARASLAEVLNAGGDRPASLAMFAEADADGRAVYGTDHPMWAQNAGAYAVALTAAGRHDEALALLEASVPVLVRSNFDPALTADILFELAKLLATREPVRARALATEALGAASADRRPWIATWLRRHPE